jgi:hypothetical protein
MKYVPSERRAPSRAERILNGQRRRGEISTREAPFVTGVPREPRGGRGVVTVGSSASRKWASAFDDAAVAGAKSAAAQSM